MKIFLKGMLEGFTLAVVSLLGCAAFIGILGGLYSISKRLHLSWWVGYGLFLIILYSLIGGIVRYFKGDK